VEASLPFEGQASCFGAGLHITLLDLFVGGGIVKCAFPQHPAEIPRFFPIEEIANGEGHGGAVLLEARDLQQLVQGFLVQINRHSHVTNMMQFASLINKKRIKKNHFYTTARGIRTSFVPGVVVDLQVSPTSIMSQP
jgi:hypothetical protein